METRHEHFASSEHQALGPQTFPGIPNEINHLPLANHLSLKYGDIIALAGDFYGIANEPIGCGETKEIRERRFLAAYQQLAHAKPDDVISILDRINRERQAVDKAIREGRDPKEGVDQDALIETLTYLNKTHLNYLELAKNNLDHFGEESLRAYEAGHAVAMQEAAKALSKTNPKEKQLQLLYAYSLEAFAGHYLTDRFASGHQRVPRHALNDKFGAEIGSLLSLLHHDEDGDHGLSLLNANGSTWMGFGDGHFFDEMNQENRHHAQMAIEAALADVFRASLTGRVMDFKECLVAKFIPFADEKNNPAPLFRVNAQTKKLEYRHELQKTHLKESEATYFELSLLALPRIFEHFILHYGNHHNASMCTRINQMKGKLQPSTWLNWSVFATNGAPEQAEKPSRSCECTLT